MLSVCEIAHTGRRDVQKKLRTQGMRHVYAIGFQLNTTGNDSNARFNDFIIAYGGQDIVTKAPRPRCSRYAATTMSRRSAAITVCLIPSALR